MWEDLHENHKIHIFPYYFLSHKMRIVNNREKKDQSYIKTLDYPPTAAQIINKSSQAFSPVLCKVTLLIFFFASSLGCDLHEITSCLSVRVNKTSTDIKSCNQIRHINPHQICIKSKTTSCHIEERLITQALSNLQYSPIINVSTQIYIYIYIYIGNKITCSLIHEMYMRSLYISYETIL